MKIFVIGAGFAGMQLARALVLERNNVVLIDHDAGRVKGRRWQRVFQSCRRQAKWEA